MTDPKGGDLGSLARHSAVYAIGNALSKVGAFLLLPIYTRYLAVAEYGAMELIYAIGAIVSGFLSIGIAHATLRFYFEYKDPVERNTVVSTNLLASIAITTTGAGAVAFFADEIATLLLGDARLATGVWVVLATLVFELSSQVALAYVRARERAMLFVAVSLGKLLLQVTVNTVLLVVFDMGVVGVLLGNFATVVLGWLVLVGFTVRNCGLRFSWAKLVPVLKYGYPFLLTTMVALVSANIDRFLITSLVTLHALGLYALAGRFASLIQELIGEPFKQAFGAFRFAVMKQDNAADMQARIVRYLLIMGSFAALALIYLVDPILYVMATPDYRPAGDLVPLLAAAALVRLLTYPLQTGIYYQKNTRDLFHIQIAVALITAFGGFALITWFGVEGACLTILMAAVTAMWLNNRFAQRYFPVRYEYGRLARIVVLAVTFHFAALPLAALGVWPAAALKLVLLALYLVAVARLGGMDPEEPAQARAFLAGRWQALRGRPAA